MKLFIRLVDLKSICYLCLPTLFCIGETFDSVGRFEINLPPMSTNLLYATQTSTVSTLIIQVVLLEIIASALNGGCYVCPAVR